VACSRAFVRSSSRIRSLSASFSETGCDTAGGAAAAAVATAAAAAGAACVTGDAGVLRDTFGSSGTGVPNIQRRKRTAGGASMILWRRPNEPLLLLVCRKQKKCLACRPLRPLEARERVYSTFSSLTLQKEHTPQHSHCAALRLLRWRSPNHTTSLLRYRATSTPKLTTPTHPFIRRAAAPRCMLDRL
jgi:hypothetical protein